MCCCLSGVPARYAGAETVDPGQVLLYNKQFRKAADRYERIIQTDTATMTDHRYYQDACFALGDSAREAVSRYYRTRLEQNPENADYSYLYGRCLPCSSAVSYFEKARKIAECHSWALNGIGACRFERNDMQGAKDAFLKTIKCDPDFGEAYQNLSQVYLKEKKIRRAKKVYRKLIVRNRANPLAYEWLGDMYLTMEEYRYAILAYKKAIHLGAQHPDVFFKAGFSSFKGNNFPQAIIWYKKSIDAGNRNFDVFYNLGTVYELVNMPQEALEQYERAYEIEPGYALRYSMGNCAVQLGLYSTAIQWYRAFLEKEPDNTEALIGLANAYQLKKDYAKAINIYNRIIVKDSTVKKAYYNLGSIYAYYLKDYNKMKQYWETYITLFPHEKDSEFLKREMEKISRN